MPAGVPEVGCLEFLTITSIYYLNKYIVLVFFNLIRASLAMTSCSIKVA